MEPPLPVRHASPQNLDGSLKACEFLTQDTSIAQKYQLALSLRDRKHYLGEVGIFKALCHPTQIRRLLCIIRYLACAAKQALA
jgi:hypothetical protein